MIINKQMLLGLLANYKALMYSNLKDEDKAVKIILDNLTSIEKQLNKI